MKYILLTALLVGACSSDIEIVGKERVFCERYKTPWSSVVFFDGKLISYRDYGSDTTFIELSNLQECEIQYKNFEVAVK